MKKLILLSFPFLFIGCSSLITLERNNRLEDKKRTEMRKIEQEEKEEMRKIAREEFRENRLKETPTDNTFTIEFPNLTQDEINNKSYLWLKTKFPNYDKIQENKGEKIIRIEGNNLLLATPEKMGYRVIIIIDTENKSVKFWIGKAVAGKVDAGRVTQFSASHSAASRPSAEPMKTEEATDMVQNYKDFLLSDR